jgi:predicted Zn-dependent peptidase
MNYKHWTLENKIKCFFSKREDSNLCSISFWVKTGTAWEKENETGIAHFLEHILFNKKESLDIFVESIGGDLNAGTSYDYTYFYITLPAERFKEGLEVISKIVLEPEITEQFVEKEKPIVLEEIVKTKDSPQESFAETFNAYLFGNTPYGNPILGYEESVKSFTKEAVERFYSETYLPESMVLSVAGNVEEEKIVESVNEIFTKFKGTSPGRKVSFEKPKREGSSFVFEHPNCEIPQILMGWLLPPCNRKDIYYEILDAVLSEGRSSLLYREIKEKNLAYAVFSNYSPMKFASCFTIGAITDKPKDCETAILESIREITEEDFELAKKKLLKSELFARESVQAEADSAGFAMTVPEDLDYHLKILDDIKSASFQEFKKVVSFLRKEPLVGILKGVGNGI